MENSSDYKLPGEFTYDGRTWGMLTSQEVLLRLKTKKVASDSLLVVGYPKSGTTWLQEIVWLIMHDGKASTIDITKRMPLLELGFPGNTTLDELKPGMILKSHLHYYDLETQVSENKVKVIVIMRNIKDTLVSYYHFYKMSLVLGNFSGNWDEFFSLFKEKRLYGGDWLEFTLSWWKERQLDNILIVHYEDIKQNPKTVIARIAEFCGKNQPDDVIASIARQTSFDVMRDNPASNLTMEPYGKLFSSPFMRKGDVGDWKTKFTKEQSDYIDLYYEPYLLSANLCFKYEI